MKVKLSTFLRDCLTKCYDTKKINHHEHEGVLIFVVPPVHEWYAENYKQFFNSNSFTTQISI